jgi:hypothetical protein
MARRRTLQRGCLTSASPAGALNAVANGRLLREGAVSAALGAARGRRRRRRGRRGALAWHRHFGHERPARGGRGDAMHGAYLGPAFDAAEIGRALDDVARALRVAAGSRAARPRRALLADGQVVGWFRRRMEFGPRALGARASSPTRGIPACSRSSIARSSSARDSALRAERARRARPGTGSTSTESRRTCSSSRRCARTTDSSAPAGRRRTPSRSRGCTRFGPTCRR